jgi:hypothetical protein
MDSSILILIGACLVFSLLCVLIAAAKDVMRTRQIEQTKRELAAYVAEGSMTPEDAMRLATSSHRQRGATKSV